MSERVGCRGGIRGQKKPSLVAILPHFSCSEGGGLFLFPPSNRTIFDLGSGTPWGLANPGGELEGPRTKLSWRPSDEVTGRPGRLGGPETQKNPSCWDFYTQPIGYQKNSTISPCHFRQLQSQMHRESQLRSGDNQPPGHTDIGGPARSWPS